QPEKGQVRGAVLELLEQCFRLDAGGVDHGELSDSKKHIIVNRLGKPHIIDFETASRKRKCRNLVSMVGYLFFKDSIGELLKPHFVWDKEALKEIIRHYKAQPSAENYRKVCAHLGFT
ncbi:MAG: hypothetical protein LUP94_03460, partial [Candidatus Methanomethylicus sp.]|nr:hypothetical protein [Candidatus Methanomethylicus sp.]